MKQYHDLLEDVLKNGNYREDRTKTGCYSVFGRQIRFDLSEGFPLLTTKKINFETIVHELVWFLSGDTNIDYLKANNVNIWNEWADEFGNLGPVYGHQWRSWGGKIDQISAVEKSIKNNPNSRRHIVSAWNVSDVDQMALPPCHCLFQFFVSGNTLSCQLYQRSADIFLGVPFNIASYALLLSAIAKTSGLVPGEFIHTFGDLHLYSNHVNQAQTLLAREPRKLPRLVFARDFDSVLDMEANDVYLEDYNPHPFIKAKVAV